MAAVNFDVDRCRCVVVDRVSPVHHSVVAAVDRRDRHPNRPSTPPHVDTLDVPQHRLVEHPWSGRVTETVDRRTERDHLVDQPRKIASGFTSNDSPEAPTDQSDRAANLVDHLSKTSFEVVQRRQRIRSMHTKAPADDVMADPSEIPAQRIRGQIVAPQPGQHDDRRRSRCPTYEPWRSGDQSPRLECDSGLVHERERTERARRNGRGGHRSSSGW